MDADPIIIAELVAQYTDDPAGLETIRKQAFTAYAARQTTNIILNSRGRDASTSAGIPLNTQESQRAFILACQVAARIISGDSTLPAGQLAPVTSFGAGVIIL